MVPVNKQYVGLTCNIVFHREDVMAIGDPLRNGAFPADLPPPPTDPSPHIMLVKQPSGGGGHHARYSASRLVAEPRKLGPQGHPLFSKGAYTTVQPKLLRGGGRAP